MPLHLKRHHICPHIIHSGNSSSVKGGIITHMRDPGRWETSKWGNVLLITHSAFFDLPYVHDTKDVPWVKIIDEIPQLDTLHSPNGPRTTASRLRLHDFRADGRYRSSSCRTPGRPSLQDVGHHVLQNTVT
jgi:hypothetical protein